MLQHKDTGGDGRVLGPRDLDHLRWLERAGLTKGKDLACLDLGCGSGYLCSELVRAGARFVAGVDIETPDPRNGAGAVFLTVDLDVTGWDLGVPRPERGARTFDLLTGFDIIEHLSSPVRFVEGCRRLLGSGGVLILTTPNISSWERLVRRERWSGATDAQHRILFNGYSLRFLLERSGFRVTRLQAPVRTLERLHIPHPGIGAQLFCVATVA